MKFAIISHAVHKEIDHKFYAYEPFVKEMNLWIENVEETRIVAPFSRENLLPIEIAYDSNKISKVELKSFHLLNLKNVLLTIINIPILLFQIYKACHWADHIHLRCPGNVGLLGCFVQIFFPNKSKTVKYAGNWDPNSKQPLTYRLQKRILSSTFLTKNCKVLVYGSWKNQTKNIVPFFTASYFKNEIIKLEQKKIDDEIKLIFVGSFSEGKQPLISVKVAEELFNKGYNVKLEMYGDGNRYTEVKNYIEYHHLEDVVKLYGNQSKDVIKKAFQKSHFLIFISKSEGWPKVVAEAMFWSCLPVSTEVSCVPFMLDYGKRGALVKSNVFEILKVLEGYINDSDKFILTIENAKSWSQDYTLEKFSQEIKKIIHD